MIDYKLSGQVALVTGAGGGIGRAACEVFARSGAKVIVADVIEATGRETVSIIESQGGTAQFVHCDVARSDDIAATVAAAIDYYGRLDCAFNNAGVNSIEDDEYADPIWERALSINLSGVMRCMREEAAVMLRNGGGSIVNMSSMNGLVGNSVQPAYTAAKHGVIGLTRHGALRWAKEGIRVNAVCPGVIETPMTAPLLANIEVKSHIDSLTPMGRIGSALEIAEAVVWLCSPAASFVTGLAMPIDGGATAI